MRILRVMFWVAVLVSSSSCTVHKYFSCTGTRTGKTVNIDVGADVTDPAGVAVNSCANSLGEPCTCLRSSKTASGSVIGPS